MSRPSIQIQLVGRGSVLAYALVPITLQDRSRVFVEFRVMRGRDGVWVALPQRKEGDGWVPVVEFPSEILERVGKAVLEAYREQLR